MKVIWLWVRSQDLQKNPPKGVEVGSRPAIAVGRLVEVEALTIDEARSVYRASLAPLTAEPPDPKDRAANEAWLSARSARARVNVVVEDLALEAKNKEAPRA